MIASFFNTEVVVLRLTTTSGNKKAYQTVFTADSMIQNADRLYSRELENVGSKIYMGFFDIDVDVREGDKIRDELSGNIFRVVAIEKQAQNLGLDADHLEVTLEKYTN